jgi:DEAD/DEAH box helicase domain-containing protein
MAVEATLWDGLLVGEELAYLGGEPAHGARSAPFPDELHPKLRAALETRGVHELYVHQAEAWEAAARGEHVAVVTGTASGKSLAFNLPVLDALAREPKQRAI